ncbi:hypothetical protein YC2023_046905 [Brassica napus]
MLKDPRSLNWDCESCLKVSTPRSRVRISDYAIYCRLQEIQVSSPRESGLLNNYADYRGKACKGSSTWCK